MWLEKEPKDLYPNTVAGAMIDLVSDNEEGYAADFFEQDIVLNGNDILASERIQERPIALFHVEYVEGLDMNPAYQKNIVRVKVRIANHNPRHVEEQQQEAIVLAQRVRSRLQGALIEVPDASAANIEIVSAVDEEINEVQLAVYKFTAQVTHTYQP